MYYTYAVRANQHINQPLNRIWNTIIKIEITLIKEYYLELEFILLKFLNLIQK